MDIIGLNNSIKRFVEKVAISDKTNTDRLINEANNIINNKMYIKSTEIFDNIEQYYNELYIEKEIVYIDRLLKLSKKYNKENDVILIAMKALETGEVDNIKDAIKYSLDKNFNYNRN